MNNDRLEAEQEAVRSLMDLYEQAKKCRQLYESTHMALPEPLQRFWGIGENGAKPPRQVHSAAHIPAPVRQDMPREAEASWISIGVEDATPTGVALAILREARGAVRQRDVTRRVTELLPNVSGGSVANIGTRLGGGLIERTDEGWKLTRPESAAVIWGGFLWGPPTVFSKQELAAHRREAILHVLKHYSAGLQTVQIVEQLHNCSWVHAPVNKDLLKADIGVLAAEGKIRRRGNTKKWEIAPADKEDS